jgi:hypothetical protein
VKNPISEATKELYDRLVQLVSEIEGKKGNAGRVKKAKRLLMELETGYGPEAAFVGGAKKILGIVDPLSPEDDE